MNELYIHYNDHFDLLYELYIAYSQVEFALTSSLRPWMPRLVGQMAHLGVGSASTILQVVCRG